MGVHPADVMAMEQMSEFPGGQERVGKVNSVIAQTLFGDALVNANGDTLNAFLEPVNALGLNNWERLRKQYNRSRAILETRQRAAERAMKSE